MQELFQHLETKGAITKQQLHGIILRQALADLPRITTTETPKPIKPWHGHSGKGYASRRRAMMRTHNPVHQTHQRSHYYRPKGH